MKTERRHDLETNELARRVTVWIEKVRPYSTQIVAVLIVLLVVWIGSSVWSAYAATKSEAAWDAYCLALTSGDLELQNMRRLADDEMYAGTSVQQWAYAAWADRQLALATREYLINREAAIKRLQSIVGVYETLAADARDEQVRDRAHYGLGRIYELQDKLDKAQAEYDQVRGDLEPLARMSADRMIAPEVKEAYAWLSTAKLPHPNLTGSPGTPGSKPSFEAELPDASGATDLNLKTLEDILGTTSNAPAEDRYGTESSAADESEASPAAEDQAPKDEAGADQTNEASEASPEDVEDIFGEEQPPEQPVTEDPQQP